MTIGPSQNEGERGRVQIDWFDKMTGQRGHFDEREAYGGSVWRRDPADADGWGGGWDTFMWEDGNYACDCNRSLFFLGLDGERPCGETLVIEALSVWPEGDGPLEATDYWEDA